MKEITIFSPATVANVSCAFDILGFAVEQAGDRMTFRKTTEKGISIVMKNYRELPSEPEKNVAGVVALAMIEKIQPGFGILIEMEKGILPGSGMGSSGASAGGAAFGVNKLLDEPFEKAELVQFAMLGEALASGVALVRWLYAGAQHKPTRRNSPAYPRKSIGKPDSPLD